MTEDQIKISVVTPAFNSAQYIEQCILSLKNQKYKNFEHIIVDGGSTDGTIEILKKYEHEYPMRWISEPDQGMYDAIDKGFRIADGEIFAWINSDDFYFPWTLYVVEKVFEKRGIHWLTGIPAAVKVFGGTEIIYQMPNLPTVFNQKMIEKGIYDGQRMYFIQQESCFWTRELWEKSGGININYKMAGDYHLWKEFAKFEALYTVHCNLASFRIHKGQKSEDAEKYYSEIGERKLIGTANKLMMIYLHIYSLINYRKYVINLDEIFGTVKEVF